MSKNRIKLTPSAITTREEAEAAMNELATWANTKRKFVANLDAKILAAQEAAAPDIATCELEIKRCAAALREWAEANPQEFGKRKSIEFVSGLLGFRTGTPKVSLLSRAWNWDKVLAAIAERGFQFLRVKEEVDKDSILAFHTGSSDKAEVEAKVLRPIGVKIVQEEAFYVEPKLTETEEKS